MVSCDSTDAGDEQGGHVGHGDEQGGHEGHGDEQGGHEGHGDEQGGHEGHGEESLREIHLTAAAVANARFSTHEVQLLTAAATQSVPAEVQYDPDRIAHISSPASGIVDSVDVTVGDVVSVGDPVVTVRSAAVGQARANLQRARSAREVAEANFERQRRLRAESISSERALLDAEMVLNEANANLSAARSELSAYGSSGGYGSELELSAPLDGTVITRDVTRGEAVTANEKLLTVANSDNVWVIGQVYGDDLNKVAENMSATFKLSSGPTRDWTGTLDYVSPTARGNSRAVEVRMKLENSSGELRPGQYGTLRFGSDDSTQTQVAAVPEESLQEVDGTWFVFKPGEEEGSFQAIPVTRGASLEGFTQILSGIEVGERVISGGSFILKSEMIRDELGSGHAH